MNDPVIATPADHRDVAEVLATAFAQDPGFQTLMPDASSRPERLLRFFEIEAGPWALDCGASWIIRDGTEPVGAAVVLPSARRHNPTRNHPATILRFMRLFGRRSLKAVRFLQVIERAHPKDEHLYLPFIGATRPGGGAGSRLLSAMSRTADAAGLPLYLEASTKTSARLYRRHGFVARETISAPGMPPTYPMWRVPSTS